MPSASSGLPDSTALARRAGVALGVGPLAFWVAARIDAPLVQRLAPYERPGLLAAAGLMCLGGLLVPRWRRMALSLAFSGSALFLGFTVPRLLGDPSAVLLLLLAVCGLLFWIASRPSGPRYQQPILYTPASMVRWAAGACLGVGIVALAGDWRETIPGLVLPAGLALPWIARRGPLFLPREAWRLRPAWIALAAILLAGASLFLRDPQLSAVLLLLALNVGLVLGLREAPPQRMADRWEPIARKPARLLVITFLVTCIGGALALSVPVCTAPGADPLSAVDAFFTATSATCVTGLIVRDTPHDFSLAGQVVILLLIQVGGLGIMTFSTAAMLLLRRRLSLSTESAMSEILGGGGRGELGIALRRMLAITAGAELLGAVALSGLFLQAGDGPVQALWRGVFTSISAFCNAGFALQSDSLMGYRHQAGILHVVSLLIIVGGLGPVVVAEIPRLLRRGRISLHARLVLLSSAGLLLLPALLIAVQEWSNTLVGMGFWDRLSNAWLHSATARTAGFNSLDVAALHPSTQVLTEILMFIGGSPGSTAGGIKTTTLVLVLLAVVDSLRSRVHSSAFGWRIPESTVRRAVAVFVLGSLSLVGGVMAVLLTQQLPLDEVLFEVTSALATVGLSMGATAGLDGLGKILIVCCMFAGRVGPVTLALSLRNEKPPPNWVHPEREVLVG